MIIFLDMDGVLCTPRFGLTREFTGPHGAIDPVCVSLLNRIIRHAGGPGACQIVLVSVWRINEGCPLGLEMIGIDAPTHKNWRTRRTTGNDTRGDHVAEWLRDNPHDEWIIIDDSRDYYRLQKYRLIRTDTYNGILFEHVVQAKELIRAIQNGTDGYAKGNR